MRVLVTGGAGYIGSVVSAVLVAAGHHVTVVDDLSTGHRDAVPAQARFVEASVEDADSILGGGFDAVMHFAAKSLVGESVEQPDIYWRVNVGGARALLDAVRSHGVPRVVFSSSCAVYGDSGDGPIGVDAPLRPNSPYGATKLAADLMLGSYASAYRFGAVSLRYFNAAGAFGALGERHAIESHLIPNVLRAVDGSGRPLSVYGTDYPTSDGTAIRDYVHVLDLADAHLRALDVAGPGSHSVFNLGTGRGSSVYEIVRAVESVTGKPVPRQLAARRPGDPAALFADASLAAKVLGWQPSRALTDMITDAWAFHRLGTPTV